MLKITRHIENFRSGQEVANGWYVETNLDSTSKVNYLKKLLTIYELEDELIVKYSDDGEAQSTPSRFAIRNKYWQQILPKLEETGLFTNVNPTKDHWLSTGAGVSGVSYTMVISKGFCRIELSIVTSSKEINKKYFKQLHSKKDEIESLFGAELIWEELPDNKMSRIKYENKNLNLFNVNDWDEMNQFFVEYLPKFEMAMRDCVKQLR